MYAAPAAYSATPSKLAFEAAATPGSTISVADLSQTVLHLQAALVSVMDETEAVKTHLLSENAKLQREFRETVDVLVAQQEQQQRLMSLTVAEQQQQQALSRGGVGGSGVARIDQRFAEVDEAVGQLRRRVNELAAAAGGSSTASGGNGDLATPHASAAALQQTRAFVERADAELTALRADTQRRVEAMERQQAELVTAAAQREIALQRQLAAYKEEQQRMQIEHMQRITNLIGGAELAGNQSQGGERGGLGPQVLSQIENIVATEVRKQVASAFRPHAAEVQQRLDLQATQLLQHQKQIGVCEELIAQQDAAAREGTKTLRDVVEKSVAQALREAKEFAAQQTGQAAASLQQEWAAKNAALVVELDEFVREYCNGEFLATVRSGAAGGSGGASGSAAAVLPASPTRALFSGGHGGAGGGGGMRDIIATSAFTTLQEEVLALRSRVDGLGEEVARASGGVVQAMHACTRADHAVTALRTKLDVDMRAEFSRSEQTQKAFFLRQEQLLDSERQNMTLKVTSEVQLMRGQLDDAMNRAEQRRLVEVQSAREQLQADFARAAATLREELAQTTRVLTEKCDKAASASVDAAVRTVTATLDAAKRAQVSAFEEVRRVATRNTDDVARLKNAVDENTTRLQEQGNYLHVRLQQILDEEVQRVDRLSDDIVLRLNTQVEAEVRRVVAATEAASVRTADQRFDVVTRDVKAIREELSSLRGSLHSVAAPSVVVDSLEKRLDVQRDDLVKLHDALTKLRSEDAQSGASKAQLQAELSRAMERQRAELMADVGTQLQRFDLALAEVAREVQLAVYGTAGSGRGSRIAIGPATPPPQQQQLLQRDAAFPQLPGGAAKASAVSDGGGAQVRHAFTPIHNHSQQQQQQQQQQQLVRQGSRVPTPTATPAGLVEDSGLAAGNAPASDAFASFADASFGAARTTPQPASRAGVQHSHHAVEVGLGGTPLPSQTRLERSSSTSSATSRPLAIPQAPRGGASSSSATAAASGSIGMSSPVPPQQQWYLQQLQQQVNSSALQAAGSTPSMATAARVSVLSPIADADILVGAFDNAGSP